MGAKSITLNNGVQMPEIGYGVFRVEEGKDLEKAVETAIRIGYRSIDTAAIYQNEKSVGKGVQNAIDAGLVTREELFITSKVWNDGLSYDETIQAYEDTLERLGLEYLDLYLIHWPGQNKYMEPWKALEALYKEGRIKSIGVSNFQVSHLEHLLETAEVKPVINQIEFHPKLVQEEVRAFCEKHDIQVEAWSPLMNAELLNHETVNEIAESLGKSAAQVILRWDLQHGVVTIPKSMTESRIKENIDIYDFELTEEQVKTLDALDEHKRIGPDPDQFDFK
ncbi:aldo/keto reductase [Rossellomorea marisflavi]|uniref:Glyoxal reductase n=1 Tax=Rossellomorea marisflavi TaxID=189381 RepID=A0A0J5SI52_9BACI|nr:aldo/keto reductase [Rossellomorea marisflavi]KMK94882.1 glyoxal reductase [Rossellomorea marisflavi]KML02994.1 glyoxal reductase [Rossellomorea marisflavi]KZE50777.1 glyoxal reductase [Rossellomorea marisflavi]MDR4938023.1 aldo/keto reductase [Rossellomorea marisflavi]TYO71389.1 aldo/keto reductase [Rossellomorea marisflavi]